MATRSQNRLSAAFGTLLLLASCLGGRGVLGPDDELYLEDDEAEIEAEPTPEALELTLSPEDIALQPAEWIIDFVPITAVGDSSVEVADGEKGEPEDLSEVEPEWRQFWVFAPRATRLAAPTRQSDQVGSLTYGEKVFGVQEGEWVRLKDGGYVQAALLTDRQAKFLKKPTRFVIAPQLHVRAEPNRFSMSVGRLDRGDAVEVLEDLPNGWTKIGDGRYVRSKHLTAKLTE